MDKIQNRSIRRDESYFYDLEDIEFIIRAATSDLIGYYTFLEFSRQGVITHVYAHIQKQVNNMMKKIEDLI